MSVWLFNLTAQDFFLTAAVIFFAAFLQGLTGFGFALLSIPLLTFITDAKTAIPLIACTAFINAIILCAHLHKKARFSDIRLLLPGSLLAIPFGAWFLSTSDEKLLRAVLGCVIIGYVLFSLSGRFVFRPKSRAWTVFFGALSGFFGGAVNAAAPPIIIYAQLMQWDKDAFRASLAMYLLATTTTVTSLHYLSGLSTQYTFITALSLMPVLFVASRVGMYAAGRFSGVLFTRMIYGLLLILATMLLLKR